VVGAPDGSHLFITNESMSTVDVIDPITLRIYKRIKLTGHPNNITITPDGKKVYAGIAAAPGAVDVIDTATLTNVKSVPVTGALFSGGTCSVCAAEAGAMSKREAITMPTASDDTAISSA